MFARWKEYLPIALIVFFSLFLFREYFLKGTVPFPANLLVSYYEPWKSYPPPEYPHGPPNKAMGFDNVRIYYPIKSVAIESVRTWQPPLWNPYNFSGNVLLGTYQSAIFHPLSWLFLLLPQIDAWSVTIIFAPILAGLAMYIFISVLGLSKSARFVSAITYAFSGFFMTWWEEAYMFTYSALFLPVVLTAVELFLRTSKKYWLALLSVSLALSITSGAFQMTFYVYLLTSFWILYRIWHHQKRWNMLAFFGLAYGISGLLAAVHVLPSMEAYYYSTRVSTDVKYIFDAYLLPLTQLVTMIVPDYFGNPATYNYFGPGFYHERLMWLGVVPFILILTQLFRRDKKRTHEEFFLTAFILTLSLVLALPTTWFLLYYVKLPLLSTMTPSRMMMLVTFSGSVIAAFATEEYWKGFAKKRLIVLTIFFILSLSAIVFIPLMLRYYDDKNTTFIISLRNTLIPAISTIATLIILWVTRKRPILRTAGFVILILLMLGNTFLFAKKYLYFSERRFVYPQLAVFDALKARTSYDRFWTYETGYIEKNFASAYGLFSPEGYDSIMNRRYAEFLAFTNSGGKTTEPDRANALIQSTDHIDDILADPYRKKTLELLGVRYILRKLTPDKNTQKISADPVELPRVWEDGTYAIHEFASALPRVQLYTDIRVTTDGQELLGNVYKKTTDIKKTIFLEEQPIDAYTFSETNGTAIITSYTPNEVVIETNAPQNSMLFLSDAYYPGWKAYVDSHVTKIYRADYAFRAVAVPIGQHTVIFRYEPASWKMGVAGSIVGILLCGICILWQKKK